MSHHAAGYDIAACLPGSEGLALEAGGRALVPTGWAMALPEGYEGQIRPRSGLASQYGVTVLNAPGTIDADYRGEVRVLLANLGSAAFRITHGQRIAQLVLARVVTCDWIEVESFEDATERGPRGFGSTGV